LIVFPFLSDRLDLWRYTDATGCVTVTLQVAFLLALVVTTEIVATPGATAVTFPVDETLATLVLLEVHLTDLSVALFGETEAKS